MDEPTLESIEDYDTLKGDKKKIFYRVIMGGVVMAVLFFIAYNYYDSAEESTAQEKEFRQVPMR